MCAPSFLRTQLDWRRWKRWSQNQRHLSTHIPPSPSADTSPEVSPYAGYCREEKKERTGKGLWTSGPVIPFLSSVAVRSWGQQSLASAAETNEGSGFPSGGCREKDVQSCDGSFRMRPGSQAPAASRRHPPLGTGHRLSRGASTITSVLQAGNREAQEVKEVFLSECPPKNLLRS